MSLLSGCSGTKQDLVYVGARAMESAVEIQKKNVTVIEVSEIGQDTVSPSVVKIYDLQILLEDGNENKYLLKINSSLFPRESDLFKQSESLKIEFDTTLGEVYSAGKTPS